MCDCVSVQIHVLSRERHAGSEREKRELEAENRVPQCRQPLPPLDPREGSTHPAGMPSAQGEGHEWRKARGE